MDSVKGVDISPKQFYSFFKGRTDRVAIYNANTSKVISLEIKKGDWEITERVRSHIEGQSRLALYNHLSDNTCTWANIIFDESTRTPTARDSLLFAQDCSILGLTEVKREKTKVKGENYACWMFFEKPISAKKVRYLISLIFKRLDLTKAEVLPAEDMLAAGSNGMYAWLPYFGGSDKWLDAKNESRMDFGVKMGHTIFLDENGEPLKNPFAKIHRYTENEIDNAILYLTDYIPADPTPNEGIHIFDSHLKKISEKCDAVNKMLAEIKNTAIMSDQTINLLAPMYKSWRRLDYFHKLISQTKGYDKAFVDKKIDSLPCVPFTPCSAFKAAGYCPEGKNCFPSKPPIIERYGKLEEDKNALKEQWREFSPAVWAFQGIKERLLEESDSETAVIDVDVIAFSDQLKTFETDLFAQRTAMIQAGRSWSGITTGLSGLNQAIDGLRPDFVTVIAGMQGIGKGALCSQIMEYCASDKQPCAYITYGESQSTVASKIMARCCGIDYRKIVRGTLSDEEVARIKDISKKIRDSYGKYMYIIEGNDSMGVKKMKMLIDALPIKLLIVDSLNMIPFISKRQAIDIPTKLEQNIRQLKTLARYKKIPILATYSTREKDSNIPELIYAEFLLMQGCDNWIYIDEGKVVDAQQNREYLMYIRKNRSGDKNIACRLAFHSAFQKFSEIK